MEQRDFKAVKNMYSGIDRGAWRFLRGACGYFAALLGCALLAWGGHAAAQTVAPYPNILGSFSGTPPVWNGGTTSATCNGNRAARLVKTQSGTMWIRVVAWGGALSDATEAGTFEIRKRDASGNYVSPPAGDVGWQIVANLNSGWKQEGPTLQNTYWYEKTFEAPAGMQIGTDEYILVNKSSVFHLGVCYQATKPDPSTNFYYYTQNTAHNDNWVIKYHHFPGGGGAVLPAGGGPTDYKMEKCCGDEFYLEAKTQGSTNISNPLPPPSASPVPGDPDAFMYSWESPLLGIDPVSRKGVDPQGRLDSSVAHFTAGVCGVVHTIKVVRKGMCDAAPQVKTVALDVKNKPSVKLDWAIDGVPDQTQGIANDPLNVCGTQNIKFTTDQVADVTKFHLYAFKQFEHDAPMDAAHRVTPAAGVTPGGTPTVIASNYQVSWNWHSPVPPGQDPSVTGAPVTWRFTLIAMNGTSDEGCVARLDRDIVVYPKVPKPQVKAYNDPDASPKKLANPAGECSPFPAKFRVEQPAGDEFAHGTRYLWQFVERAVPNGATPMPPSPALDPPTKSTDPPKAGGNVLPHGTSSVPGTASSGPVHSFRYVGDEAKSPNTGRLIVTDRSGNCFNYGEAQVNVRPLLQALFKIEHIAPSEEGKPCSPVKIKATSTGRIPNQGTPGNQVKYTWMYRPKRTPNANFHGFTPPVITTAGELEYSFENPIKGTQPTADPGGWTGITFPLANNTHVETEPLELRLSVMYQTGEQCEVVTQSNLTVHPNPKVDKNASGKDLTVTRKVFPCGDTRMKVDVEAIGVANTQSYAWRLVPLDPTTLTEQGSGIQLGGGVYTPATPPTIKLTDLELPPNPTYQKAVWKIELTLRSDKGCDAVYSENIEVPGRMQALMTSLSPTVGCPDVDGKRKVEIRNESGPLPSLPSPPPPPTTIAKYEWWVEDVTTPPTPAVKVGEQNSGMAFVPTTPATQYDMQISGGTDQYSLQLNNLTAPPSAVRKTYKVTLKAIYDEDGNMATTGDQCIRSQEMQLVTLPRVNVDFIAEKFPLAVPPAPPTLWQGGVPTYPPASPPVYPSSPTQECGPVKLEFRLNGTTDPTWKYSWSSTLVTTPPPPGMARVQGAGEKVQAELTNPTGSLQTYVVRLTGRSADLCEGFKEYTFSVLPQVQAKLEVQTLDVCTPYKVRIKDGTVTGGAHAPTLNVDGGVENPPASGIYEYDNTTNAPITKTITLSSTLGTCSSTAAPYSFVVLPRVKPQLDPLIPGDKLCAPVDVTFKQTSPVANNGCTKLTWYLERLAGGLSGDGGSLSTKGDVSQVNRRYENRTDAPIEYEVKLVGENERGCQAEYKVPLTIYPEAQPDNKWQLTHPCSPTEVTFESKSKSLSDYQWTFTPVGPFAANGAVEVRTGVQGAPGTVILTNTGGASGNDELEYEITYKGWKQWPAGGPKCETSVLGVGVENKVKVPPPLTPNFVITSADGDEICSGAEVTFQSNTTGGGAVHEMWEWGDGESLENPRPTVAAHKFRNTGDVDKVYRVKVTSRQYEYGCQKETEIPITVHPEVKSLFSHETASADQCNYPFPVTFKNLSRGNTATSGVTTDYKWDYGYQWGTPPVQQGEVRHDKAPHQYTFYNAANNLKRNYNVTLTTVQTYPSGRVCQDQYSSPVTVWPGLQPDFTVDNPEGCLPHKVKFTPTGATTSGVYNRFEFGDGEQSVEVEGNTQVVSHEYKDESITTKTVYHVKMTMRDQRGCEKTVTRDVAVHPKVTANFSLDKPQYCNPAQVHVENLSKNGKEYSWTVDGDPSILIPSTPNAVPFDITVTNPLPNASKHYKLKLHAKATIDNFTCEADFERPFEVLPGVVADFTPSATTVCADAPVVFTNTSSGLADYEWYVDGIFQTKDATLRYVFKNESTTTDRTAEVRLHAKNTLGCSQDKTVSITVRPRVDAIIQVDNVEGCTPLILHAETLVKSPAYSYLWTIPAGVPNTSTQDATGPVQIDNPLTTPMTAEIKLRVSLTADPTCFYETTRNVIVHPKAKADFDVNLVGCNQLVLKPRNTSVVHDPSSASWLWTTGQGQSSTQFEPELRLINTSRVADLPVEVTLEVTSKTGCKDRVTKTATVHPSPIASFKIEGRSESCAPFNVTITNESEGPANMSYTFDFGDGATHTTTSKAPFQHLFDNNDPDDKSYQIKMTAETADHCKDEAVRDIIVYAKTQAAFDFDPGDSGCSPLVLKMVNNSLGAKQSRWDFGDGTIVEMQAPEHVFVNTTTTDVTYTVKLTTYTQHDCKSETTKDVTVFASPKASFAVNPPLQVYPDATVQITNTTVPQAASWIYSWSFGDGHTSNLRDPVEHVYDHWAPKADGFAYTIKLTVESPKCRDEVEQKVFIYAPLPKGAFESEVNQGCAPLRIFFVNNVEYADKYEWSFGDGTFSDEKEPIHTFNQPGTYNVKLTATGDGGTSSFYGIYVAHVPPVAKFTVHPTRVMLPRAIVKMQPEVLEHVTSYTWSFGDGETSDEVAPLHEYKAAGAYEVKLRVESGEGCTDTVVSPAVTVLPQGKILFPTVFRPSELGPNGGDYELNDKLNQVFHPYTDGISEYTLYVYNRWGELIFESNDVRKGWDGYRRGHLCESGVYAWRAVGHFFNGEIFDLRGNVTLLR